MWVRLLKLLQSSSEEVQREFKGDKFKEYIAEQWKRADVNRDGTLNLDEVMILMRKMNIEVPKKELKEKMKGRPHMNPDEFSQMMLEMMSQRPEVDTLVTEIKQQFNKGNKGRGDGGDLTVPEFLYFLNTMQRLPGEPEVTLDDVNAYMMDRPISNSGTLSKVQFSMVLDNVRNSVVHPVATSRGCGGSVSLSLSRSLSPFVYLSV